MIYILEQRLRAQSIAVDKAKKVLTDVVRTMFSEVFLRELFKPQEVYTNRATRAVFDRLAHSSIMRLNKTSMDKLYDLMTMGFKLQTLHAVEPAQLLTVTLNHLDSLKALLSGVGPVRDLLDMAAAMSRARYEPMRPGELWRLKHALCRFFQDRRIKVSLFLQDGLQSMDGTLVLTFAGPLPVGTEIPGTLRYYHGHSGGAAAGAAGAGGAGAGARGGTAGAAGAASKTEHIAALALPGAFTATSREVRAACRLGENIYAKDRSGAAAAAGSSAGNNAANAAAAASPSSGASAAKPARPRGYSSDSDASPAASALSPAAGAASPSPSGGAGAASTTGHSRASLDLLASLVGPGSAAGSAAAGSAGAAGGAAEFKFFLFGDDGELAGSGGADGGGGAGDENVIVFDAADASRLRGMMARLGIDDEGDKKASTAAGSAASSSAAPAAGAAGAGAPPTALGTGDDLLDLMDAL